MCLVWSEVHDGFQCTCLVADHRDPVELWCHEAYRHLLRVILLSRGIKYYRTLQSSVHTVSLCPQNTNVNTVAIRFVVKSEHFESSFPPLSSVCVSPCLPSLHLCPWMNKNMSTNMFHLWEIKSINSVIIRFLWGLPPHSLKARTRGD
jgi:hypothetical protein